jgi:hypothetical protein
MLHQTHTARSRMKGMKIRIIMGNSNKFQDDPRTIVGARLPANASVQARMRG